MSETPVFSTAAVAAPHPRATQTGQMILAAGGNAVEAAIAMAATSAVMLPHLNGLGGDAFVLVREPRGRVHAIDASGPAGALATIERYRRTEYDRIPVSGPDAALTVAGAPAGWSLALELAHALGGRLPLDMLLTDAITLAHEGYAVAATEAKAPMDVDLLSPAFATAFLAEGKRATTGHIRVLQKLADTLGRLSHAGLLDFYRGDVGREIALDLERIGSPVTRRDLETYRARVVEPISVRLSDATLYGLPAPSQGMASLVAAGIMDRLGQNRASDEVGYHHRLIEATKRALTLRDRYLADRREVEVDLEEFLVDGFLRREAGQIDLGRAASARLPRPEGDAAWIGCIDADGLAVSYAQSVHGPFGSGCMLPGTGILWHNRGIAFSLDPDSPTALAPGRKPFHSLNPLLAVFADNRIVASGASSLQAHAQAFSRYARLGRSLAEAIEAPRWVLAAGDRGDAALLAVEEGFDNAAMRGLGRLGHPVEDILNPSMGQVGMVARHPRNGRVEAFFDPRGDGDVMGL